MYQNIDNMICDADSCEAAICECKRMRKADITAAIIWAAVAVSAFLLILLDAILDINIGDIVAYILLLIFTGVFACAAMIFGWIFFAVYPIIDIVGLSIKIQTLRHTKEAYAQYMKQTPEQ